jgi:thiamine pyrophosphate-dependent acetolactate synthase large subunit-like protein
MTHMRGRMPERWHVTHDFGAIGQGLPTAIGIAVARGDGKVILIEGDGSLLMHVQELEVLARQRIKLLTCTLNDGAYSAEVHKLVPAGVDPGEAIFGRPDLSLMAKGFGLAGETVASEGRMRDLFAAHERADRSTVWDVLVSGKVVSQQYRRVFWGEN